MEDARPVVADDPVPLIKGVNVVPVQPQARALVVVDVVVPQHQVRRVNELAPPRLPTRVKVVGVVESDLVPLIGDGITRTRHTQGTHVMHKVTPHQPASTGSDTHVPVLPDLTILDHPVPGLPPTTDHRMLNPRNVMLNDEIPDGHILGTIPARNPNKRITQRPATIKDRTLLPHKTIPSLGSHLLVLMHPSLDQKRGTRRISVHQPLNRITRKHRHTPLHRPHRPHHPRHTPLRRHNPGRTFVCSQQQVHRDPHRESHHQQQTDPSTPTADAAVAGHRTIGPVGQVVGP